MIDELFDNPVAARRYLVTVGETKDANIDLFEAALALAAVHHPLISVDKYRQHFQKMCRDLQDHYQKQSDENAGGGLALRAASLRFVMAQTHGYMGDDLHYDDLQNADLMRVIDRRLGLPITLSILAIALCRAMGWEADGLNFPGHFLVRMNNGSERIIFDPFQGGAELNAPELRKILKRNMGDHAELSADYYAPCSNRDTLLRLQNNIKFRLIDTEHYREAMEIVDIMMLVAPDDHRLHLDMAVLLARLESAKTAIDHLQKYIDAVQDPADKSEAQAFLSDLKSILH